MHCGNSDPASERGEGYHRSLGQPCIALHSPPMRRADRLFRIVQHLRRRHVVTAKQLAEAMEVSERTIYRDVQDLMASGVPVESEAGVGYRLRGYDLPPLMFDQEEIEAVVLGARMVERWTDPELAAAARRALAKVEAVLPESRSRLLEETALFAPRGYSQTHISVDFAALRKAIRERRKIHFSYQDAEGAGSRRTVRPLALAFFGSVWNLVSWCELREDFRAFRPDRMAELQVLQEAFVEEPGRTLADFARRHETEGC